MLWNFQDVLKKITHYMMHTNCKLQMAAVLCVHNLSLIEEQGSADRQVKLREIGVYKILQQLLTTNDSALFDKWDICWNTLSVKYL